MMLTNLASILRGAGLPVVEVAGWQTRGHGQMTGVRGVLWHHTATAASARGDYPSQNIVTNGRSDLPGPLANLGLGRNGTWYVIAAGLAYHAGSGSHPAVGTNGNAYLIGIEAEHPGTAGNPWPAAQIDSYRRGTAALLRAYGLGADRCIAHREWAPGRKIDPYGLDMAAERRYVANFMTANGGTTGGIESMAFNDGFRDWSGNSQTVLSWMNNVDKRMAELHAALLGLQKSRIPGDQNQTNVVNAVMDAASWSNQTMGHAVAARTAAEKAEFELTYKHPSRVEGADTSESGYHDTMLGYTVNADKYGYENQKRLDELEEKMDKILKLLGGK